MICTYITLRLAKLGLSEKHESLCKQAVNRLKTSAGNGISKAQVIKRICKKILRICEQEITPASKQDIMQILGLVKKLMQEIFEPYCYDFLLLRIQLNLVLSKAYSVEPNSSLQKFYLRFELFLKEIQTSIFSKEAHADFYSNIELLYLLIIKNQISRMDPHAQQNIGHCFKALSSQITALDSLMCYEESKVYMTMQKKVQKAVVLYRLEVIALKMFPNDEASITDSWQKYQDLFKVFPVHIAQYGMAGDEVEKPEMYESKIKKVQQVKPYIKPQAIRLRISSKSTKNIESHHQNVKNRQNKQTRRSLLRCQTKDRAIKNDQTSLSRPRDISMHADEKKPKTKSLSQSKPRVRLPLLGLRTQSAAILPMMVRMDSSTQEHYQMMNPFDMGRAKSTSLTKCNRNSRNYKIFVPSLALNKLKLNSPQQLSI